MILRILWFFSSPISREIDHPDRSKSLPQYHSLATPDWTEPKCLFLVASMGFTASFCSFTSFGASTVVPRSLGARKTAGTTVVPSSFKALTWEFPNKGEVWQGWMWGESSKLGWVCFSLRCRADYMCRCIYCVSTCHEWLIMCWIILLWLLAVSGVNIWASNCHDSFLNLET